MAFKWPKDPNNPLSPDEPELAARKCKVCEWEGQLVVRPGEDPDCPWCHAPTEASVAPGTQPSRKNPHAAALGRLGGLKGGQARAKALTAAQRRKIASRAARVRWANRKKDKNGD